MPLYEYRCQLCRTRFEQVRSIAERLTARCPACDGPVNQLVSVPRIRTDSLDINHVDPTFGPVDSKHKLEMMEKQAGLVRREPGDEIHFKRARESREQKQTEARRKIIGETLQELVW